MVNMWNFHSCIQLKINEKIDSIPKGVAHADEVLYMFPIREAFFSNTLPTKEDEQVREAVVQLFVDFARTG